jgi:ubiquinone/menaquinone biosynthesis C-methylase UbiE
MEKNDSRQEDNDMNRTGSINGRLSQEKVRTLYNDLARFYDIWGAMTEGRARRKGIKLAQIRDGESVLDVAAGTGLILADVVRQNPKGFNAGIDISAGMLQKARGKLKGSSARIELKEGSAFEIPYPDQTFDLLFNGYMFDLMSFEAMPKILAEFKRVLKPSGRLVLINMTIGERFGSQIYDWVYTLSPAVVGGCRGVRLTGPLESAGFGVITREYHQQFLFPSEVILAKVG